MSAASLATRVKARREELGLSQRALPGIDQGLLSRIERGQAKDPGLDTMAKLAKGLGLSIEELATGTVSSVRMIELREIEADPQNPRAMQAGDAIDATLMDSIKGVGLIQPLAVRRQPEAGGTTPWMVVDGHRRYAALVTLHGPRSRIAVPCRLVEGDAKQTLLMQLVANVQRADMNPWDLARAIGQLVEQDMDTQAIADALGRKRRWVQEMASVGRRLYNHAAVELAGGRLSISQAIAIAAAEKDEPAQRALVERVKADNLNEDDIRAIAADQKAAAKAKPAQLDIEELVPPKGKQTTAKSKWTHRRGYIEIVVQQLGQHEFAAVYDYKWRQGGGSGGVLKRAQKPRKTAAIAFLVAARQPYANVKAAAKGNPEDVAAAIEAWTWVYESLEKLGATQSDLTDWRLNNPPPAKPTSKPTPSSINRKLKIEQPVDPTKPPAWATAEWLAGPFMYHTGRRALLVHGWPKMLELVLADGNGEVGDFYSRNAWQDDEDGKPFDYGSCVVRLVEAPK